MRMPSQLNIGAVAARSSRASRAVVGIGVALLCGTTALGAQVPPAPVPSPPAQTPPVKTAPAVPAAPKPAAPNPAAPQGVPTPADYVIGPDDLLTVVYWRDKELSGDVAVRPDGKISLPLLNDIQAAGLTPEQLRVAVTAAAGKFLEEPTVTVVVRQINSRRVYITGQVGKPGPYNLSGPMTVLQLIATAGGVLEYADTKNIVVMRTENGKPVSYPFNYKDVTKRKNLKQNIELKPGDTVIVP
jgi:polysaccharide export outer membrane protein